MNPVQGVPFANYKPSSAGSDLPPLASRTPWPLGTSSKGTADAIANGSMHFGGAISGQTPNGSPSPTDPNTQSAGSPGQQSDGFFTVLQNLMGQLDAMIGQLLGTPATPVSGGGTAGPIPGDGTITSPPDGALITAPATREPL
jgi:hypothetical protein